MTTHNILNIERLKLGRSKPLDNLEFILTPTSTNPLSPISKTRHHNLGLHTLVLQASRS